MLVFKIALIGIAGAMLAMVTKQFKPEYSTLVLWQSVYSCWISDF